MCLYGYEMPQNIRLNIGHWFMSKPMANIEPNVLAIGLCLNIVIQAFANIAVSVHLVPVTGLTLPIISMGGTSVVFTCIALGIILSVSKYVEEYSNYEILEEEAAVAEVEPVQNIKSNRPKYENYY